MHAVIDLMKANLHRQLPVREMADAVQLSPSHLRQLFKQGTGVAMSCYLRRLRMETARELLETTFLNVKEIAARVGISSASYFAANFKRAFRARPGDYLKRRRIAGKPRNR